MWQGVSTSRRPVLCFVVPFNPFPLTLLCPRRLGEGSTIVCPLHKSAFSLETGTDSILPPPPPLPCASVFSDVL
jgi:hypothetical protein